MCTRLKVIEETTHRIFIVMHQRFTIAISVYLKPDIYQKIYRQNKSFVCPPEEWVQMIYKSDHKWLMIPQLDLLFLKMIVLKCTIPERIKLFRILCNHGMISKIWYMIHAYEGSLNMGSMVCDYITEFSPYKDNKTLSYFYDHMDRNRDSLRNIDDLLRACVAHNNIPILEHIHSMTHAYWNKTLGLKGVKKRSIAIPSSLLRYSISMDKTDVFEYLIQNNTYYNKDLSSIVDKCTMSHPKYITIIQKVYPLNLYYTGMDVVTTISPTVYHILSDLVKNPEWFHYTYLSNAIQNNDSSRVMDVIKRYPYSICMSRHRSITKSIHKPWYEMMLDTHPCGMDHCE
jgi:hypothetical protein